MKDVIMFLFLCVLFLAIFPAVLTLVEKFVKSLGNRLHWFKKYCIKNGKRLGKEQIKEFSGNLLLKYFFEVFLLGLVSVALVLFVNHWVQTVGAFVSCFLFVYVLFLFHSAFLGVKLEQYCLFCSESKEEVECHIEEKCRKNQYYRLTVTDICFEDGLYMIFQKDLKEIQAAMEETFKVYVRECNDSRKKWLSGKFIWLIFAPVSIAVAGSVYWLAKELGLPGDWPITLEGVFLVGAALVFYCTKDQFVRERIDTLRKEENLPKEKYEVHLKYDNASGGKLVYRVRERTYAEQERMARNNSRE